MNNTITVSLNIFERKFLLYVADNYGEVNLNHKGISDEAEKALDNLTKKGALSRVVIIGTGSYRYTLTSMGTNLVDLIKEQSVQ